MFHLTFSFLIFRGLTIFQNTEYEFKIVKSFKKIISV